MAGVTRTATANMPDAGDRIIRVETANIPLVTDIPQSEADALIYLYNIGGGVGWTNQTGWKTDPVVGNWDGITVSGGHVTRILLQSNNGTGDISGFKAESFTKLQRLYLHDNSFSGDLSSWDLSGLVNFTRLYLHSNSTSGTVQLPDGVQTIQFQDNAMIVSNVDAIISAIWTNRANWTYSAPQLHIGGTNATPTGTYQDGGATPATALEKIHDLIFDDNSEGFQTWAAISWNGGSAP